MGRWVRAAGFVLALACGFFGLAPVVGYGGIVNAGVIGLLLLAAVLGGLCLFWEHLARWRRSRAVLAVLLAAAIGGGAALSGVMVWAGYHDTPKEGEDYTLVVLGCLIKGDQPSIMLTRRLQAALSYLLAHPETPVVVAGGQGPDELYPEAEVMKNYLAAHGVDPARIYTEPSSTDTKENLAFSAAIIRQEGLPSQVAVVSDGFHLFRARLYANRAGLPAVSLPCDTPWGLIPAYWMREFFAVARAIVLP